MLHFGSVYEAERLKKPRSLVQDNNIFVTIPDGIPPEVRKSHTA